MSVSVSAQNQRSPEVLKAGFERPLGAEPLPTVRRTLDTAQGAVLLAQLTSQPLAPGVAAEIWAKTEAAAKVKEETGEALPGCDGNHAACMMQAACGFGDMMQKNPVIAMRVEAISRLREKDPSFQPSKAGDIQDLIKAEMNLIAEERKNVPPEAPPVPVRQLPAHLQQFARRAPVEQKSETQAVVPEPVVAQPKPKASVRPTPPVAKKTAVTAPTPIVARRVEPSLRTTKPVEVQLPQVKPNETKKTEVRLDPVQTTRAEQVVKPLIVKPTETRPIQIVDVTKQGEMPRIVEPLIKMAAKPVEPVIMPQRFEPQPSPERRPIFIAAEIKPIPQIVERPKPVDQKPVKGAEAKPVTIFSFKEATKPSSRKEIPVQFKPPNPESKRQPPLKIVARSLQPEVSIKNVVAKSVEQIVDVPKVKQETTKRVIKRQPEVAVRRPVQKTELRLSRPAARTEQRKRMRSVEIKTVNPAKKKEPVLNRRPIKELRTKVRSAERRPTEVKRKTTKETQIIGVAKRIERKVNTIFARDAQPKQREFTPPRSEHIHVKTIPQKVQIRSIFSYARDVLKAPVQKTEKITPKIKVELKKPVEIAQEVITALKIEQNPHITETAKNSKHEQLIHLISSLDKYKDLVEELFQPPQPAQHMPQSIFVDQQMEVAPEELRNKPQGIIPPSFILLIKPLIPALLAMLTNVCTE